VSPASKFTLVSKSRANRAVQSAALQSAVMT